VTTSPDLRARPAWQRTSATLPEAAFVFAVPVALFALRWVWRQHSASSTAAVVGSYSTGAITATYSTAALINTLVFEILVAMVLLPVLWRRGWRPSAVAGAPQVMDLLRGAALWLAMFAAVYVIHLLGHPAVVPPAGAATSAPAAAFVIVTAVINPLVQEFLWLGYVIPTLAPRFGVRIAAAVSVCLRVLVHVNQGGYALLSILPLPIIFTWYYARTRRLWPVIVAHIIADAVGLGAHLFGGG
jgi:membrane protease YdiL (CAAX protease family)